MLRFVLLFLLLATFAVTQEAVPSSVAPHASETPKKKDGETKSANAPVITIKGVCNPSGPSLKNPPAADSESKGANSDCKTVVSKSEFEELADMLQVPPQARKQFASQYATALIMASEAHKRGLDHGAHYEQLLKLAKLQVLTRQLAQSLQEESAKVPDQEIETYYKNNSPAYEEATLDRLYIPRTKQQDPPKEGANEAAEKKRQDDAEAAMKKEADDLRARAAAGEDFVKLQAEAYKFAGAKGTPPEVKMEKTRRTALPPAQTAVLDLKPGDVSQVFADPGGYFVYKLEKKDAVPLATVHDEIRATLQKQRMQDATQTMQQAATPTFDDAYFAASTPAAPSLSPGGKPAPRAPASNPTTGPK